MAGSSDRGQFLLDLLGALTGSPFRAPAGQTDGFVIHPPVMRAHMLDKSYSPCPRGSSRPTFFEAEHNLHIPDSLLAAVAIANPAELAASPGPPRHCRLSARLPLPSR